MLTPFVLSLLLGASPLETHLAFQEGKRLVESFEYEKAVFRFREAARDESLGLERATALVWLGLTYAKLGEQPAADEAFLEAVRLDPLVALPPSTPPKILEALEAARRKLREERVAATTPTNTTPTNTTPTNTTPTHTTPTHTTPTNTTPTHTTPTHTTPTNTTPTNTTPAHTAPAHTTPANPDDGPGVETPPPPPSPPLLTVGGGALLGIGGLVAGGGAVLGALAASSSSAAFAASFQDERQALNDTASNQALLANVLYGVGGAIVLGGGAVLAAGLAGGAP